jgi:hypothetical protein
MATSRVPEDAARGPSRLRATARAHRWFAMSAAVCVIAFGWLITGWTFQLDYPESFGDFYDYQAASLLQGRLDVPKDAIGWEAFVVEGKYYGYFGITPALIRMPFVALGIGFGRLSRTFMLCFFSLGLLAAYGALGHASALLTGRPPPPWTTVLFTLNVGLGSTLFFLGSRAFIYHEALLCGAAFALASGYCSLRYLAAPEKRWWSAALLCGVLAMQARPTVGLFALSLVACAALAILLTVWGASAAGSRRSTLAPMAIVALSGVGVLSYAGVSYLKFKTFDGAPLQYHIQFDPKQLAGIQGKKLHLDNARYNLATYLWRLNVDVSPAFPYLNPGVTPVQEYPEATIPYAERTLALPYAMPALSFLASLGCLYGFWRWPAVRVPILVLVAGTLPMAGAILTALAVTHRYTADFCPPLILAAAMGFAALTATRWQRSLRGIVGALTLCSILVTLAITLRYQGEGIWGVPDDVKARYQRLKQRMDGVFRVTSR